MNKLARYIIITVGVALVAFLAWYFSNILAYLLIAGVLSLIGRPLVNVLNRLRIGKRKFPHFLSAMITVIALWAIFLLFLLLLSPLITNFFNQLSTINSNQLIANLSDNLIQVELWIKEHIFGVDDTFNLQELLEEKLRGIVNTSAVVGVFGSVANMLVSLAVALFAITFITFFFLKEDNLFYEGMLALFPTKYESNARHALNTIAQLLRRYFIGIFADMLCVMTLLTTGLTLVVGLPFSTAIVLGFLGGILNMIPYIGPLISLLFGLTMGTATAFNAWDIPLYIPLLKMACVYITINIIDAMVFQPYIYSNSIKAHPLEIFLVILTAGSIAGIFGMILAIPTYMVVRVLAKEFFNQYRLVQKLTEKI
ncbi:MAG: AI-2E family transporter [Bacteroidales bacterium]|nr:AI-2E family transporter [Bacteroidales bacterium]MCL2132818.1 AI-2E family transporter [Bacteroidales bacterium]